jgi:hypothetical protein
LLAQLEGYINEPYRMEEVIEAARTLQPPFLCREVVQASGLPRMVVHTRLTRLVKKGVLTRCKAMMTVPGAFGPYTKACYLYSWAKR